MPTAASTQFDPYHKWLGIPPQEQPPNHYRLLGISLFESDAEVIAAGADRQMGHVKSFAAGEYATASQALLNELARARVTLLNSRRKAEYDRKLNQSLGNVGNTLVDTAQPRTHQSETDSFIDIAPPLNRPLPSASIRRRGNNSDSMPAILIVTLLLGGLLAVIGFAMTNSPDHEDQLATSKRLLSDRTPYVIQQRKSNPTPPRDSPHLMPAPPAQPRQMLQPPLPFPDRKNEVPRQVQSEAPEADYAVDLDLKNKRQRIQLNDSVSKLKILSLKGCEAQYEVTPQGGTVADTSDETAKAFITIHGVRDATMWIVLKATPKKPSFIEIDYHITNDAGQDMPFTLTALDRLRADIRRQGVKEAKVLGVLQAESASLQAWLNAPGVKPLVQRGQARDRLTAIGPMISDQAAAVQSLEANLQVADQVKELATHLNGCTLELSKTE